MRRFEDYITRTPERRISPERVANLHESIRALTRLAKEYEITILVPNSRRSKVKPVPGDKEVRVGFVQEQFRFPRSKKKRMRKKWAADPKNYRLPRTKPMFTTMPVGPGKTYRCCELLGEPNEVTLVPIQAVDASSSGDPFGSLPGSSSSARQILRVGKVRNRTSSPHFTFDTESTTPMFSNLERSKDAENDHQGAGEEAPRDVPDL